jgi:phenylalanyl-tRNA synthetase beta chain
LGDEFEINSSAALLRRLELTVVVDGDSMTVTVPTNRPDLTRPADLVEEIARLADFDTFAETVPTGPAGGLVVEQRRTRRARDLLRGLGLMQVINLPFVSEEELLAFSAAGPGGVTADVVTVCNPLRDDQSKLRQSLLPGLLRKLRENRNRGAQSVSLFETGRVFRARPWSDDSRVPEQPVLLGLAAIGPFGKSKIGTKPDRADATTALAIVESLAAGLGLDIGRHQAVAPGFHPTRTAALMIGDTPIGFAGELHPDVADEFELDGRVAIVEVELSALVAEQPGIQLSPVSTFPHVDFDLSFEVEMAASAGELATSTRRASDLVETATIFDDYRDSGSGLRAVGVRYRLRAEDRTLDADEIAAEREKMIDKAGALGAKLRGGA